MERCPWCSPNEKMIRYHDEEWGVPVHDDQKQFEFLMMEVMQCGLNWNMMIEKREIFRECFTDFDYDKVAAFDDADVQRISENAKGWRKELNKISWNGAAPKYDIRDWAPDHEKMGKGVTLTEEEAAKLKELL